LEYLLFDLKSFLWRTIFENAVVCGGTKFGGKVQCWTQVESFGGARMIDFTTTIA
jgi:hypothetical protein